MATTFIKSVGNGENVICLHSSMSSSRQWQDLMQRLQHSFRVIALDLHGYGAGPDWAVGAVPTLGQEVELLAGLINELDGPIHLVGHSYGGAVAIKAAQTYGDRISSLTLYEPVIFSVLLPVESKHPASVEVKNLIEDVQRNYRRGDLFPAAQRFIDYWSGAGSWAALPLRKQFSLAAKVPTVLANFEAVLSDTGLIEGLDDLQLPTLYLSGNESPASVKAITGLMKYKLRNAIRHRFAGMGHMGPITHAEIVNACIERFIRRQTAVDRQKRYALAA